jgi:hypothetical protein
MKVQRLTAHRNSREAKTGSDSPPRRGLLSLRDAVIIAGGVVAAVAAVALTCWVSRNVVAAALAGFPAFARTVEFLDRFIDDDAPAT